jgi:heat shock protein HtpX
MNNLKTIILFAVLTAIFMFAGGLIGGYYGMIIALGLAVVMNFGAYWYSDKMVLRMYNAQEVSPNQAPELFRMVERLALAEKMPMPRVYIIPEAAPNAFATGRNPQNAAVAVTEGILRLLTPEELEGVLAHELGHVKNRDILVSTVAGTFAGAISMLAQFAFFLPFFNSSDDEEGGAANPLVGLLGLIFAPVAATIIQLAISRSREFGADKTGAHATGNPMALASALRKIENYSREVPMRSGDPATAHLFFINPFKGASLAKLFSTHPATEDRIARLEQIAGQLGKKASI